MELPKNIRTRLRLRVKLWERKIEDLKKQEAEYGASFTREELKDEEVRTKYGTKMTAFKYAKVKLQKEISLWKKMLKGEGIPEGQTSALCPTDTNSSPSPAPSSVAHEEPVSS